MDKHLVEDWKNSPYWTRETVRDLTVFMPLLLAGIVASTILLRRTKAALLGAEHAA